jgi:hypothetical protein
LKCTRTVSPALKSGTSRSWRRSRLSMIVLMEEAADGRSGMIAKREVTPSRPRPT